MYIPNTIREGKRMTHQKRPVFIKSLSPWFLRDDAVGLNGASFGILATESPSGRRPISSGRCFRKMAFRGRGMAKTRREKMKKADRHPQREIMYWKRGTNRRELKPMPTLASPLAVPLFLSNQWARMIVQGAILRQGIPIPATTP